MKQGPKEVASQQKLSVEEGNKIIAEFMGASCPVMDNTVLAFILSGERFPDNMYRCKITDLKYHSSWDWLMPVYNKIKKIYYKEYNGDKQDRDMKRLFGNVQALILEVNIELSCRHIVEFIQWYNETKK